MSRIQFIISGSKAWWVRKTTWLIIIKITHCSQGMNFTHYFIITQTLFFFKLYCFVEQINSLFTKSIVNELWIVIIIFTRLHLRSFNKSSKVFSFKLTSILRQKSLFGSHIVTNRMLFSYCFRSSASIWISKKIFTD